MTFKELCGYLCETLQLIEDLVSSYNWSVSTADMKALYQIHESALNLFNDAKDIEKDLVSLMLIGENIRDDDAALANILDSDCLAIIKNIRENAAQ